MTADTLRFFRMAKNYKQEYVAARLNMEQSSYSDLENGKTRISPQHAEKLAELYGVSKEVFLEDGKTVINNNIGENSTSKTIHSFEQYHEANKEIFAPILAKLDQLIDQTNEERRLLMEERSRVFALLEKMLDNRK